MTVNCISGGFLNADNLFSFYLLLRLNISSYIFCKHNAADVLVEFRVQEEIHTHGECVQIIAEKIQNKELS